MARKNTHTVEASAIADTAANCLLWHPRSHADGKNCPRTGKEAGSSHTIPHWDATCWHKQLASKPTCPTLTHVYPPPRKMA